MEREKKNGGNTGVERLILIVFAGSFTLYFLNILVGKGAIHWGWNIFYLGNVGEFILLLVASIALIVAALHREHVEESKKLTNLQEGEKNHD